MFKKIYSLALMVFLLPSLVNAIKPEISTIRDDRDGRERLRIVGSFTAFPKPQEVSGDEPFSPGAPPPPLNVRIRTIEPRDFGTVEAPGPITLQRAGPLMDHYEGGRRPFTVTINETFPLWDGRLLGMSPATGYCLETEDGTSIGHAGLGRQTLTQFVFFSVIEERFQRHGITSAMLTYLLDEFIPTLRAHPITTAQTAPFTSMLIKTDVTHPIEETALRELAEFAATRQLRMTHTIGAPSAEAFTAYASRHADQEFTPALDAKLQRTEHRWVIDISAASADDAAAAEEQPA